MALHDVAAVWNIPLRNERLNHTLVVFAIIFYCCWYSKYIEKLAVRACSSNYYKKGSRTGPLLLISSLKLMLLFQSNIFILNHTRPSCSIVILLYHNMLLLLQYSSMFICCRFKCILPSRCILPTEYLFVHFFLYFRCLKFYCCSVPYKYVFVWIEKNVHYIL